MKTSILIKGLLGMPLLLLVSWVLMTIFGCSASLFGAGNSFYCGPYCMVGKGLLFLSAVLFIAMFIPEIRQFLSYKKKAHTAIKF